MADLSDSTSIHDLNLGSLGTAREEDGFALPRAKGEGDAGLPMGSGMKVHFGLPFSSDAASSRWAMRPHRI